MKPAALRACSNLHTSTSATRTTRGDVALSPMWEASRRDHFVSKINKDVGFWAFKRAEIFFTLYLDEVTVTISQSLV